MAACCIAYTTDATYLFPTLVSAIGARRHSSIEKADVIIFCFDLDRVTELVFAPICKRENILLVQVNLDVIHGATAMMSRLFLTRFVPSSYTQYLYMDGDVLISGSLDPLIDAQVPAGSFLAANDPFTFLLEDNTWQSLKLKAHLRKVGISGPGAFTYFNSGVLRIHSAGWEEIGERAWEQFRRNKVPSRFPDQDAMNLAASENRLPMSLRWNYPAFLRNALVEDDIDPKIHHFMSSPKPWQGCFAPWDAGACQPYLQLTRSYPETRIYLLRLPFHLRVKYSLQQRAKQVVETLSWGFSERRERVLEYERMCLQLSTTTLAVPPPVTQSYAVT